MTGAVNASSVTDGKVRAWRRMGHTMEGERVDIEILRI